MGRAAQSGVVRAMVSDPLAYRKAHLEACTMFVKASWQSRAYSLSSKKLLQKEEIIDKNR